MNRGTTLIIPLKWNHSDVCNGDCSGWAYFFPVRSAAPKSIPHCPLSAPSTADSLQTGETCTTLFHSKLFFWLLHYKSII